MDLLRDAAERSIRFLETLSGRPVRPDPAAVAGLEGLAGPLPEQPCDPGEVLAQLDRLGSPATLGTAGPRFFGFVIGGALPPAVAANWLAAAWDQNAGLTVCSPVASRIEDIALGWLVDLAGLPAGTGGGFVTGATVANFTALAAARHEVLRREGWDVEARGLYGAPEIRVIVGEEAHPTLAKAIAMLGLGRERVTRMPVDGQGRVRADALPVIEGPAILCLQAGNINTGAFDPMGELVPAARDAGAWVHVDGAFGFWAAASRKLAPLARGMELADSWATDAHKWLNVPYDSGVALVRDPVALRRAMSISAAYLPEQDHREPSHYTPELSRRARGVEIWTTLRTLGRAGVEEMVERCCRHASRFAEGLAAAGYEVLNDVVLNQVLVSFGTAERTREVIQRIQADGTCWCGGTVWQGRTAMRISVCSWATTEEDVERSLEAMLRIAGRVAE
jgi:glutamate/tyrosine decarboxylase-like PLP-dependent enzyme